MNIDDIEVDLSGLKRQYSANRRVLEGQIPGLPELRHIGFATFRRVGRLSSHIHHGLFEFCLIVRGQVVWRVGDEHYELQGGEVFLTWPDEDHGGFHELMHPCTIYWMHLAVPRPGSKASRTFLNLPAREAELLCRSLHGLNARHLHGAERLEPLYRSIFEGLESMNLLGILRARAALQCCCAELIALPEHGEKIIRMPGIRRVRSFLTDVPVPWPSVAELAELSGMSSSHFHTCFVKAIGQTPMEFAHRVRLEKAKALLKRHSVTEVATRLGYSSSQHFAVCFKKYLGLKPTHFRTV